MKILLVSDVHCEFHKDGGLSVLATFGDADLLVVAGDLATKNTIFGALKFLCGRYKNVVYVNGNHELYGQSPEWLAEVRTACQAAFPNLHWLANEAKTVDGVRFAGATLWFPDQHDNLGHEHRLGDFRYIKDFKPWVYEQNLAAHDLFKQVAGNVDFIVTHHLPHEICIHRQFRGDKLNRFFVDHTCGPLVDRCGAAYWAYGHTHIGGTIQVPYTDTKLICNPVGYPHERDRDGFVFNPNFTVTL